FKEGGKVGVNVTYFENGKTKLREVVSLNGTIKSEEMNEEGKLVSEKASRNQVPVGTWKYYWPDGKTVKIKEEYENGLLNGTRLVYYQNGEKQVDETYQFGMVTGLEYRKFKRPFPPPAAPLPPARRRAAPTARRGWEYSLDAMSAAGRGQAQPGRDERCWNASLD